MANQKEFKEGIESYRKRFLDELRAMNTNIDGFVDARNSKEDVKHLIQFYQRSLDRCVEYLSEIEKYLSEIERLNGDVPEDDKNVNTVVRRTSVPGRESIEEDSNEVRPENRDG